MDEVKLLQSSLILLRTMMMEAEHFLGDWHNKYDNIEENYAAFKQTTEELGAELRIVQKETKNYRNYIPVYETAKELQRVSRELEKIVTGPLIIIEASRKLAQTAAQAAKLISQIGTMGGTDEEHIFTMLTADQINQVYQWVAENESVRK